MALIGGAIVPAGSGAGGRNASVEGAGRGRQQMAEDLRKLHENAGKIAEYGSACTRLPAGEPAARENRNALLA